MGAGTNLGEDLLRSLEQPRLDPPVELKALLQKRGGVPILQHRDLAVDLLDLLAKEQRERRVENLVDRRLVQLTLEGHRIGRDRSVVKRRCASISAAPELLPGLIAVDRRHREQQVKGIAHVGNAAIRLPNGLPHGASPERVKVGNLLARAVHREAVERTPQGSRQFLAQLPKHGREDIPRLRIAIHRRHFQSEAVNVARLREAWTNQRSQPPGRAAGRRCRPDVRPPLEQLHRRELVLEHLEHMILAGVPQGVHMKVGAQLRRRSFDAGTFPDLQQQKRAE